MVAELKKYLLSNGYPLTVCWSEDATRITGGIEYKYSSDQLTGLVAPLDDNGMPKINTFDCSSPVKIISYIKNYPVGRNVQLAMVQPIAANAAPFCIQYYCTDNKFTASDVIRKWNFIQKELEREGIHIVCKATDGDSRFIGAMLGKMQLPCDEKNSLGDWFVGSAKLKEIYVQDPTHLANKFRTRLMNLNKQMILGKHNVPQFHTINVSRKKDCD